MAEERNIVILGASVGGLSAAHYLCRHSLPKLQQSKEATYKLHLVDPSTHFWWHIAAPRSLVSVKETKHEDYFLPIMKGFEQYPAAVKESIVFHHGSASELNTAARRVSIKNADGSEETLEYYALIIASGVRSPTPLTTLHGDHTISQRALEEMNEKLKTAKEVVVGGGGPVAVETAGELGTHLKDAKITLVAGGNKLLPILRKGLADKAQKQLEKVGVKVLYDVKVTGSEQSADGKTVVKLDNGESILADAYIPAVGVSPNTDYLPENLKRDNGYVKTNSETLRVDEAGSRVYAVGDVAGVDKGGVMNMYNTIPIFGANFNHDLQVAGVVEKKYKFKNPETQVVPVGKSGGVGAFNGWSMPGFAISMLKGKDYMKGMIPKITEGKQWAKA